MSSVSYSFLFPVKNERFSTPYSQTPCLKERAVTVQVLLTNVLWQRHVWNSADCGGNTTDSRCAAWYMLHATLTCTLLHLIHLFNCFPLTRTLFLEQCDFDPVILKIKFSDYIFFKNNYFYDEKYHQPVLKLKVNVSSNETAVLETACAKRQILYRSLFYVFRPARNMT